MNKFAFIFCFAIFAFISTLSAQTLKDNPLCHYVGLKVGSSTIMQDYTSATLGLTYELKKYEGKLGIGFFGEYHFGPNSEFLMGFPVYAHKFIHDDLTAYFGPGIGFISSLDYAFDRDKDIDKEFVKKRNNRANLLVRGGLSWDYKVLNSKSEEYMRISPYMNLDIIAQYKTYLSIGVNMSFLIY
jgi:hypothetical protein